MDYDDQLDDEDSSAFVHKCMDNPDMISEFPDSQQRLTVCYSMYRAEYQLLN